MFRKSLVDKLNKYVFFQYLFVILPIIMVVIYGYAYMTDLTRLAGVFAYNDKLSASAYESGALKLVQHIETKEGVTRAVIQGDFSDGVTVKQDDVIFYIQAYNNNWFQLVTKENATMMEHCDLFDAEPVEGTTIKITYGDYSHDFEVGDLICAVSVAESGNYRVTFLEEEGYYYELEALPMLELLSQDDGWYAIKVLDTYTVETSDYELNFCTNLPTDSIYYNEDLSSFVKNVSPDYGKMFLLQSNIYMVILACAIMTFLLWKISQLKELSLLDNVYVVRVNLFATILLAFCVPFTLMLL